MHSITAYHAGKDQIGPMQLSKGVKKLTWVDQSKTWTLLSYKEKFLRKANMLPSHINDLSRSGLFIHILSLFTPIIQNIAEGLG